MAPKASTQPESKKARARIEGPRPAPPPAPNDAPPDEGGERQRQTEGEPYDVTGDDDADLMIEHGDLAAAEELRKTEGDYGTTGARSTGGYGGREAPQGDFGVGNSRKILSKVDRESTKRRG